MAIYYNGKHSITFTRISDGVVKNTWRDLYLVPSTRPSIAPPNPKIQMIVLPRSNVVLDLTNSLSKNIIYEGCEGKWDFYIDHDRWPHWADAFDAIGGFFDGTMFRVTLEDDPENYYTGIIKINGYSPDASYSKVTIDYNLNWYMNDTTPVTPEVIVSDRDLYIVYEGIFHPTPGENEPYYLLGPRIKMETEKSITYFEATLDVSEPYEYEQWSIDIQRLWLASPTNGRDFKIDIQRIADVAEDDPTPKYTLYKTEDKGFSRYFLASSNVDVDSIGMNEHCEVEDMFKLKNEVYSITHNNRGRYDSNPDAVEYYAAGPIPVIDSGYDYSEDYVANQYDRYKFVIQMLVDTDYEDLYLMSADCGHSYHDGSLSDSFSYNLVNPSKIDHPNKFALTFSFDLSGDGNTKHKSRFNANQLYIISPHRNQKFYAVIVRVPYSYSVHDVPDVDDFPSLDGKYYGPDTIRYLGGAYDGADLYLPTEHGKDRAKDKEFYLTAGIDIPSTSLYPESPYSLSKYLTKFSFAFDIEEFSQYDTVGAILFKGMYTNGTDVTEYYLLGASYDATNETNKRLTFSTDGYSDSSNWTYAFDEIYIASNKISDFSTLSIYRIAISEEEQSSHILYDELTNNIGAISLSSVPTQITMDELLSIKNAVRCHTPTDPVFDQRGDFDNTLAVYKFGVQMRTYDEAYTSGVYYLIGYVGVPDGSGNTLVRQICFPINNPRKSLITIDLSAYRNDPDSTVRFYFDRLWIGGTTDDSANGYYAEIEYLNDTATIDDIVDILDFPRVPGTRYIPVVSNSDYVAQISDAVYLPVDEGAAPMLNADHYNITTSIALPENTQYPNGFFDDAQYVNNFDFYIEYAKGTGTGAGIYDLACVANSVVGESDGIYQFVDYDNPRINRMFTTDSYGYCIKLNDRFIYSNDKSKSDFNRIEDQYKFYFEYQIKNRRGNANYPLYLVYFAEQKSTGKKYPVLISAYDYSISNPLQAHLDVGWWFNSEEAKAEWNFELDRFYLLTRLKIVESFDLSFERKKYS